MWSTPAGTAALVAGLVSVVVAFISYLSNQRAVRQAQFKDILAKRIELYPKLWRITILFETNWTNEGQPKTREWAQQYVDELNAFNLEGGLFFSQDLYTKFGELRHALYAAIEDTVPGAVVDVERTRQLRAIVYGNGKPGLSTFLKDDLGSYLGLVVQSRKK